MNDPEQPFDQWWAAQVKRARSELKKRRATERIIDNADLLSVLDLKREKLGLYRIHPEGVDADLRESSLNNSAASSSEQADVVRFISQARLRPPITAFALLDWVEQQGGDIPIPEDFATRVAALPKLQSRPRKKRLTDTWSKLIPELVRKGFTSPSQVFSALQSQPGVQTFIVNGEKRLQRIDSRGLTHTLSLNELTQRMHSMEKNASNRRFRTVEP